MTFLQSPVPHQYRSLAKPLPEGWVRCGYCGGTGVQVNVQNRRGQACTNPSCCGGVMRPSGVF